MIGRQMFDSVLTLRADGLMMTWICAPDHGAMCIIIAIPVIGADIVEAVHHSLKESAPMVLEE